MAEDEKKDVTGGAADGQDAAAEEEYEYEYDISEEQELEAAVS